ncbi:hypothetical protein K0M31_014068, partial [Melipona bicolor]
MRQDKLRTLKFGAPTTAPLYFHPPGRGCSRVRKRGEREREDTEAEEAKRRIHASRGQDRGNGVH